MRMNRAVRTTFVDRVDPNTSPKQIDFAMEGSILAMVTPTIIVPELHDAGKAVVGQIIPLPKFQNANQNANLYADLSVNDGVIRLPGIYRTNGDTLTYCMAGVGRECPTEFSVSKGSQHTLISLKRFSTGEDEIEASLKKLEAHIKKDEIGWITSVHFKDGNDQLAQTVSGLSRLKVLTQYSTPNDEGRDYGRFTPAGLRAMSKLKRLETFNTYCPMDNDCLAELSKISSLRTARFTVPTLTDAGLEPALNWSNLKRLRLLDAEQLTGAGLQHLVSLPSLTYLSVSGCQHVSDEGLASISDLSQPSTLTRLSLNGMKQVTDNGLQHIMSLRSLTSLYLSDTKNVTAPQLAKLASLPNLESLGLPDSAVNDDFLALISKRSQLTQLRIKGAKITDAGLSHLANMNSLTCLWLGSTRITDAGIEQLRGLQDLVELDVSNTDITNEGLKVIGSSFPKLTDIYLNGCMGISDEGLMRLTHLEELNYVIVSEDRFSSNAMSKLRLSRWTPQEGEEVSIQVR